MYDIAVIGAGPAGSTLARLAGGKYKVLLVDKRRFDDGSDTVADGKCCGGLLAPDAQGMLSVLGLGLPKSVLVDPQLFVVRAIDMQHSIERFYQRYYINMDRSRFDRWLVSLVPKSVDVRTSCRLRSFEREDGRFVLNMIVDGKPVVEEARVIVGADGALSRVRRAAAHDSPMPKAYFAIQEWVEAEGQLPYFSTIFDKELSDYYCWTIPKGEHLLIGAALDPKKNASAKFAMLKDKLRSMGYRFGNVVRREGAHILRPVSMRQISTGGNGTALIGEAAGMISPSSAEGFSYAFRTALALAESLKHSIDGFEERYHRLTRRLRWNIFVKNLKSRFIFSPTLRKTIMRSGLNSMRIHGNGDV